MRPSVEKGKTLQPTMDLTTWAPSFIARWLSVLQADLRALCICFITGRSHCSSAVGVVKHLDVLCLLLVGCQPLLIIYRPASMCTAQVPGTAYKPAF